MTRSKHHDSDILSRRPVIQAVQRLDRKSVLEEAGIAGSETFMEAAIAAGMIIAHSDGYASVAEHRRVIALFKGHPVLKAFSVNEVAQEIEAHVAAFALDAGTARDRAYELIRVSTLTDRQFETLLKLCEEVLGADTVTYVAEQQALADIRALRISQV